MNNVENYRYLNPTNIKTLSKSDIEVKGLKVLTIFVEKMKEDAPNEFSNLKRPILYTDIKEKYNKGGLECMWHIYDYAYAIDETYGVEFFEYMDNMLSIYNDVNEDNILVPTEDYEDYVRENMFESNYDCLNTLPYNIFDAINWFEVSQSNVSALEIITFENKDYYIV